ncbi:hypothetical protein LIA77_04143 [Sarocladium implicatum]|nr:hypothetical protein LIA77_04143 [Sarocladium implicatum]
MSAQCDGEKPCGRCRDRSLDCHFANRVWTPKRNIQDEITSQTEQLRRRNYLLDAICATSGSVDDVLGALRFAGLSYDDAYEKVQAGDDASALIIATTATTTTTTTTTNAIAATAAAAAATTGQDNKCNFDSGGYETNRSSPTLGSPFSPSGQSLFPSSNNPFTEDFAYQSRPSISPDHPEPDLLQQQIDPVQSDPWHSSAQEVRPGSSKPAKAESPRKTGSKARKRADAAVCARLAQDDASPQDWQRGKTTERSRIASNKCRTRKRNEASKLAWREQAMNGQNRELSRRFNALQAELFMLKAHLLQHTDCSCLLIQSYLGDGPEKPLGCLATGLPALLSSSAQVSQRSPAAPCGRRRSLWMEGQIVVPSRDLDGEQHMQALSPAYHPPKGPLAETLVPQPVWREMGSAGLHDPDGFMNGVLKDAELKVW